jgi:hypothetical protein
MECKCGSQDGEYKSGISKKTGRPWKGWKCSGCSEMTFLRDNAQPSSNQSAPNPIVELMKRQNELLAKILSAVSTKTTLEKEELQPDEETPF